ncbi:hypothetical protein KP509_30G057500 [Ceratopteris richardii]|nr:hypothetical protein KP509_30G057500 [Ceratopteris richardii]
MYAKCGSLIKAQQVFAKLHVRNVVCWNALISAFVKHGHNEEALCLFDQMCLDYVSPDAVTFIHSLKACANTGAIEKAFEIHEHVESKGLLKSALMVGNALVDTFAKLGLFHKAEQVFSSLLIQDAVSWNSLITGYIEHGYGAKAVECYEHMQDANVVPNLVTFICALKAFSSMGAPDKGLDTHCEIERLGLLQKESSFGNILVDMYAQGGWLSRAKEVFDKLPARNIVAWNALIAGCAEYGKGNDALKYYEEMKHLEIVPDAITVVSSLRSCGLIGALDKGREIHAEIERRGTFKYNQVVGNALIDFYAKCNMLGVAHEVFEGLVFRDVISWNMLIAGYVEHGFYEEALKYLDDMQLQGVYPDSITFIYSLKACNSEATVDKAKYIHTELERKNLLETEPVVGNALVDIYCKIGLLRRAHEVFDVLPARDHFSWNTLLAGYVEHGGYEDALDLFKFMQSQQVPPDEVTFVCGLKACASIKALFEGINMHVEIERRGLLVSNHPIGSSLIDMYGKCGVITKAKEVLDRLPLRDSISWNALLAGYTEQGSAEETLKCLGQMRLEGIPLNVPAVVCSLRACASIGSTSLSEGLLTEIKQKRFLERNYLVSSTLVDMCVKCGSVAKAREVFDQLLVRDVVSWNILMAGYAEIGHIDEALACFDQMQFEGVAPDAVTYINSLKTFATMGATEKGQEMHTEIVMKGLLEKELSLGNTMIFLYSKCGAVTMARQVFATLNVRDIVSWNTLLAGYAQVGQNGYLFSTFNSMVSHNVKPDVITFVIMLNACSRSSLFSTSQSYFEAMSKDYGVFPCLEHHSCMVDLFGRAGQLDEAAAIIEKMPISPNVVVWHSLLYACKSWGNVQVGNQAFTQAANIDDQDGASNVLSSRIQVES